MKRPLSKRQKRALAALLKAPQMRERLDFISGQSNSPELVASLRRKGLELPCERIKKTDQDGNPCHPGRYSLTDRDKRLAVQLLGASYAK
jgi:hypothetical protein